MIFFYIFLIITKYGSPPFQGELMFVGYFGLILLHTQKQKIFLPFASSSNFLLWASPTPIV